MRHSVLTSKKITARFAAPKTTTPFQRILNSVHKAAWHEWAAKHAKRSSLLSDLREHRTGLNGHVSSRRRSSDGVPRIGAHGRPNCVSNWEDVLVLQLRGPVRAKLIGTPRMDPLPMPFAIPWSCRSDRVVRASQNSLPEVQTRSSSMNRQLIKKCVYGGMHR